MLAAVRSHQSTSSTPNQSSRKGMKHERSIVVTPRWGVEASKIVPLTSPTSLRFDRVGCPRNRAPQTTTGARPRAEITISRRSFVKTSSSSRNTTCLPRAAATPALRAAPGPLREASRTNRARASVSIAAGGSDPSSTTTSSQSPTVCDVTESTASRRRSGRLCVGRTMLKSGSGRSAEGAEVGSADVRGEL